MRTLRAKLKSRTGETIGEVLVALLVSTVAILMLASMITSSFNLVTKSRKTMEEYYTQSSTGTVTVTIEANDTELEQYTVPSVSAQLGSTEIVSYAP